MSRGRRQSKTSLRKKSTSTEMAAIKKRTPRSANYKRRSTESSKNPFSQRKVVLYTEEKKAVEFKRHGVFLHENQQQEGFTLQTQMDYFRDPGNSDGKHLVTLTQMSSENCLVLTKESQKLKAVSFPLKDFEKKKAAIAEQLASSSNITDTSALQRHLFFVRVEADGTAQFQSFDKNYYLCGTRRKVFLQQNEGDGGGLRFIVEPKSGETSLPQ